MTDDEMIVMTWTTMDKTRMRETMTWEQFKEENSMLFVSGDFAEWAEELDKGETVDYVGAGVLIRRVG